MDIKINHILHRGLNHQVDMIKDMVVVEGVEVVVEVEVVNLLWYNLLRHVVM